MGRPHDFELRPFFRLADRRYAVYFDVLSEGAWAERLSRAAALAYAGESMRLTTRLLDLASWLLIRRAIKEGEMTEAEAAASIDLFVAEVMPHVAALAVPA